MGNELISGRISGDFNLRYFGLFHHYFKEMFWDLTRKHQIQLSRLRNPKRGLADQRFKSIPNTRINVTQIPEIETFLTDLEKRENVEKLGKSSPENWFPSFPQKNEPRGYDVTTQLLTWDQTPIFGGDFHIFWQLAIDDQGQKNVGTKKTPEKQ